MITVTVFNDRKETISCKRFKSMNRAQDFAADVVGCVYDATTIRIDTGDECGEIDCWQLRDRAVIDGYELPVHREMLARQ